MNPASGENRPRAGKPGEKTGQRCPMCGEPVLRQTNTAGNGRALGNRLVCSKRGCPWQGHD